MRPYYADDSVTLYHGDCLDVLRERPDASVDAVVTDPPYDLTAGKKGGTGTASVNLDSPYGRSRIGTGNGSGGFMGKKWDATGVAFQPETWRLVLRVLKPGGHLLSFGGSRTWHRLTCAIEDAGFEIRDSIAWLYGSGFPKSRDVTEAMVARLAGEPPAGPVARDIAPGVYRVTTYLREARDKAGWNNRRIDALFGTNGMAGHWTSQASQPAVPSVRQWLVLKAELGFDDELDELVEQLAATERPEREDDEPAGQTGPFLGTLRKGTEYEPAGGWGTALKPAFEPIVVARKPLTGTVAANVLEHGTGALNIDGCRKGTDGGTRDPGYDSRSPESVSAYGDGLNGRSSERVEGLGRWPTNVVLDESQAAELDQQTGTLTSGGRAAGTYGLMGYHGADAAPMPAVEGDSGGASRFFPVFRYEPKASTSERPRDGEVAHPTVKPLDLMRWLVRLVTPPGGVVLDPFAGSGTTAEACVIEGFRCIVIEREADYLPLIVNRLSKPIPLVLDFGEAG